MSNIFREGKKKHEFAIAIKYRIVLNKPNPA